MDEIQVGEYYYFEGRRFKVLEKLPNGRIRLLLEALKNSTRDVGADELSSSPVGRVGFTDAGFGGSLKTRGFARDQGKRTRA